MTDRRIRQLRLLNQRLLGPPCARPDAAVRWLTAVQAQDYAGAKWALSLRTGGLGETTIDTAFDAGRILRTHVLRPTWHFVAPDDIKWLLALTAARVHALNAYQYRRLEMTPGDLKVSRRVLESELKDGRFRTRQELADAFARRRLAATGHRLIYLLIHAELERVICSGPRRGRQFTYALLDERAPGARVQSSIDEALAELTTRYMQSHGPASLRDFSWWSGLTMREARRGIEVAGDALASHTIGGLTLWMSSAPPPRLLTPPAALLLPNYDEYFIAYKDRASFVSSGNAGAPAVIPRDALTHVLVLDGGFAGTWRRQMKSTRVSVDVKPRQPLTPKAQKALVREGKKFASFLGADITLSMR